MSVHSLGSGRVLPCGYAFHGPLSRGATDTQSRKKGSQHIQIVCSGRALGENLDVCYTYTLVRLRRSKLDNLLVITLQLEGLVVAFLAIIHENALPESIVSRLELV